jgi:hypothetical protein
MVVGPITPRSSAAAKMNGFKVLPAARGALAKSIAPACSFSKYPVDPT